VNRRIRDNGQNVLHSSFQTRSVSSRCYFHIFFRNSFFEKACVSNIIITIRFNYITMFFINNVIINNHYGGPQHLTLFYKIPMGTHNIFLKFIDNLGTRPQKGSPGLYRGADKSLARPPSRCILFDGENISFDASLVMYINSTNIPPIIIINRVYENQNLLSLSLVSFLVGLRTYQHPCTTLYIHMILYFW
jgi:hypothetical protein